MYNSNTIFVKLDASPFVSSLYPTFLGEETRELKVAVQSANTTSFSYCLANRTTVVPVIRSEPVPVVCSTNASLLINCDTKLTAYYCAFYLRPGNYTIEMMDSIGDYTATTGGLNTLQVIARPALSNIRVPALPLDVSTQFEVIG